MESASFIEKDLILIGVTAVEDKLQEEVPETIQDLLMAGKIKGIKKSIIFRY